MSRPLASRLARAIGGVVLFIFCLATGEATPTESSIAGPTAFAVVGFGDAVMYASGWCPAHIQLRGIASGKRVTTTFWRSSGEELVSARSEHVSTGADTAFVLTLPPDPRKAGFSEIEVWIRIDVDGESSASLGPFAVKTTIAPMLVSAEPISDSRVRQKFCVVLPEQLPHDLIAYEKIDLIVLRGLGPRDLPHDVRRALLHAVANGSILFAAPVDGTLSVESWEDLLPAYPSGRATWPEKKPTPRDASEYPRLEGIRLARWETEADTPPLMAMRRWGRGYLGVLAADPVSPLALERVSAELARQGFLGMDYRDWGLVEMLEAMVWRERVSPLSHSQFLLAALSFGYPFLVGAAMAFAIRSRPGRVTAAVIGSGVVVTTIVLAAWGRAERHESLEVIEVFPRVDLALRHRIDSPERMKAPARLISCAEIFARAREPLSFTFDLAAGAIGARRQDLPFYSVEPATTDGEFRGFLMKGMGEHAVELRNGALPLAVAFLSDGSEYVPLGPLDANETVTVTAPPNAGLRVGGGTASNPGAAPFPPKPILNEEEKAFAAFAGPVIGSPQKTGLRIVGATRDGRIVVVHPDVWMIGGAFHFIRMSAKPSRADTTPQQELAHGE
jgi:hypothetical protein